MVSSSIRLHQEGSACPLTLDTPNNLSHGLAQIQRSLLPVHIKLLTRGVQMEKRLMLGKGVEYRITGQNLETTHQLIYLHALKSQHLSLMVFTVPKLPACCMNYTPTVVKLTWELAQDSL